MVDVAGGDFGHVQWIKPVMMQSKNGYIPGHQRFPRRKTLNPRLFAGRNRSLSVQNRIFAWVRRDVAATEPRQESPCVASSFAWKIEGDIKHDVGQRNAYLDVVLYTCSRPFSKRIFLVDGLYLSYHRL